MTDPGGVICDEMTEARVAIGRSDSESSNVRTKGSASYREAAPREVGNSRTLSTMEDLLDCPICMNTMYPPIYQCPNGHTICSHCKDRVHKSCPTCRVELGNIRCLALEKVARSLELHCKYQISGCCVILPYYFKLKHERICKYRPYSCPYKFQEQECSVVGDISSLVSHLEIDHKVQMHYRCNYFNTYSKSSTWKPTVINCFDSHFCLHFDATSTSVGTAPAYMAVIRFMGSPDGARQFKYSVEVGGSGRKLTWQGIPRSICDSLKKVQDSHDGFIIPKKLAHFFSGGDMRKLNLELIIKIWKDRET